MLASTDPVAVTALGRRLALPPRVRTLVQAESLFNDATSLGLFRLAISVASIVVLIRRRTRDPVLETVIALVTPYGAYVLAEYPHTSGVTAVVVTGVILGSTGHQLTDAHAQHEEAEARCRIAEAGLTHLEQIADLDGGRRQIIGSRKRRRQITASVSRRSAWATTAPR